jgi:hypothetical protein
VTLCAWSLVLGLSSRNASLLAIPKYPQGDIQIQKLGLREVAKVQYIRARSRKASSKVRSLCPEAKQGVAIPKVTRNTRLIQKTSNDIIDLEPSVCIRTKSKTAIKDVGKTVTTTVEKSKRAEAFRVRCCNTQRIERGRRL